MSRLTSRFNSAICFLIAASEAAEDLALVREALPLRAALLRPGLLRSVPPPWDVELPLRAAAAFVSLP
ncbi:MAG: hypothetical protein E5X19_21175, partial [Mesorhizobium sp.]